MECQKKVIFLVNDYSSLSIEQANIIKEILQIYYIQIKENEQIKEISIDKYIQNKNQIIDILKIVNYSDTEVQKFLKIYKSLSLRIAFIDNHKQDSKIFCTKKDVAIILQRCLQCVNINSNIIYGEELENGKEHYWNQVKIDGKWYNVDLALDIPKLKKKKSDYCLVDDEDFYEFHNAKSGEKHYCKEEYNYKFIRVFLKTGIFKEQLLSSYIEIMKTQFKKIFENNKKEKILALPSGKTHEKI